MAHSSQAPSGAVLTTSQRDDMKNTRIALTSLLSSAALALAACGGGDGGGEGDRTLNFSYMAG